MSARRRRRRREQNAGSPGKKVLVGLAAVVTCVAIAAGAGALWVLDVAASAPSIDTLKPADSGANSEVFAADGTSLGYVQADVLRTPVPLKEIPNRLQSATIAIEDENFYDHSGVDYGAILRAGIENFEAGEVKQGASTITQQLVRNLYINNPEDTLKRKIIEAKMAMQYEDEYSKRQILNEYLNTAAYGTNDGKTAVGVQAASEVFFDKPVSEINLNEAALLAGLPQAPTDYNPFTNAEAAKHRRNQVLAAMADQGYISDATYVKARKQGLGLKRGFKYESRTQQYFFDFVQQELIDKYGVSKVRDGGLKVYTTLDPGLQALAERSIAAHPVSGAAEALVSTDVDTGEIKAMASSESYEDSQFNLAAQGRRQPGSSFKPYALTAAVAQGVDPDSTYYPAPSTISIRRGSASSRGPSPAAPAARSASATRPRTRSTPSTRSWSLTSAPTRWTRWRRRWASRARCRGTLPTSSGRATSPSSTSRTASRRSPTGGSITTRPRSTRSSSPTAASTSPMTPRETGWCPMGSRTRSPT